MGNGVIWHSQNMCRPGTLNERNFQSHIKIFFYIFLLKNNVWLKESASLYFLHFRIIFSILTQLVFVFHVQKYFYIFLDHVETLHLFDHVWHFFSLFQMISILFTTILLLFVFFLLQKDLDIFHKSIFEDFHCFLYPVKVYIYRKKL